MKQSTPNASTQFELTSTAQTNPIDAGIVIANEANFVCLPLDRIGLVDSDVVKSMTSSCECVRPSFIAFVDTSGSTAKGLKIDFLPDANAGAFEPAIELSVAVVIELENGERRTVKVNFKHVSRCEH